MTSVHHPDALAPEQLASLRADYESESRYRLMQNAVTAQGVDSVALDRTIVRPALTDTEEAMARELSAPNLPGSPSRWK